ncbi:MAG: anhydro-N-acetylmuramic acid kinase [Nitrospirales bacterium]|nr:anhydro-N-acetylmuramic acid kinase [Nitrospira sp.]MDR4500555.1 anhydro-N-acetylmuramic acid kinase [Nitrospirales bacterium]
MIVVGLMSGTSADGIDVAIVKIRNTTHRLSIKLISFESVPYSRSLRKRLLQAAEHAHVAEICHLHALMGEMFAKATLNALTHANLSAHRVQLIGSHGQTIHHLPQPRREPGVGPIRSTLQIGDPSIIAERTGIATIADFRARDMAAGGEGAPFAPYAHHLLFGHHSRSRLVVNLGGIANVTVLPARAKLTQVRAFDTGPCNMLLDAIVSELSSGRRSMDRGGRLAKNGRVDETILRFLLSHRYLRKKPPKSTGREEFGHDYVRQILTKTRQRHLSLADILATCCRFLARSIHDSGRWIKEDIHEVIIGGGGIYNASLVEELKKAFTPVPVRTMDDCGTHSKAFEAMAFAILAYQSYHGVCANIPSVTGARHPVVLGTMAPGRTNVTRTQARITGSMARNA